MATANEMADQIEARLDKRDSKGSPGYEDFDLEEAISQAIELWYEKFISKVNNRRFVGLEETEARAQGFSALINRDSLSQSPDQTGVYPNGTYYDLPEKFRYTLSESVLVDFTKCNDEVTPVYADVDFVQHGEYETLIGNVYKRPFKNSYKARVWRMVAAPENTGYTDSTQRTRKRHELITDGTFNVSEYKMVYIRHHDPIVVDRENPANQRNCELDLDVHETIIEMATDILSGQTMQQRLKNIESIKDLK